MWFLMGHNVRIDSEDMGMEKCCVSDGQLVGSSMTMTTAATNQLTVFHLHRELDMYSKSLDHPMCMTLNSIELGVGSTTPLLEASLFPVLAATLLLGGLLKVDCMSRCIVGEGTSSRAHEHIIWNESEQRMMRWSWIAVNKKCVLGEKTTSDADCL
ncbi:uncharacterized protein LAESUDRAFT_717224 [Laetiporus sulphureus 93-53]|uniref:Uncharacterized protein n=1 Tax=Laetiporus sulphureus 93-53 TaxID=1314785 RepID=A0A165BYM7_9APHY|nr:uncharacterized protein LAESUDRAFT_717224 [Laetiporus sulphureus 93-53]KZT01888.1 hypothetical protein LAESUDRAFT_717224 [Laetiporus sulphureus 93-53]